MEKESRSEVTHIQLVIQDVLYWIEENLYTTLPLAEIARKSGYSKWYFQRQFASITGFTPADYISRRKMTIAAYLLRHTRNPVVNIAYYLGYGEQTTFCRAFRRHFGETPTSYRRHLELRMEKLQPPLVITSG